jgi:hypothetical protein
MQPLKHSILKVIAYFDVFDYPVTVDEIKLYIDTPFTESELCFALHQLQQYNTVYRFSKFYSLRNEYALVERRLNGNMLAEKKLKQAARISKFLMWFPYIKGVAVSGSLSKNFAYEGGDIDFFIITTASRLWLTRTFFTAFYYLAKFIGLKDFFCLNYFIDEQALEIPEKNLFTAIEIATLKVQQGKGVFDVFFESNKWVCGYLPNCNIQNTAAGDGKPYITRFIQWLFNNNLGNKIDDAINNFYKKRWTKLMAKKLYAKNGFLYGSYIADKHACKHIPHYFQEKILRKYEEKLQKIDAIYYPSELVAV